MGMSAKTHRLVAAACLLVAPVATCSLANAATVTQTKPFSSLTTGTESMTWNQFDSGLGTLTGITLTLDGTASGSFTVFNSDAFATANLSDPKDRLRLVFGGGGAPGVQQTTQATLTTTPAFPFELGMESSQPFDLSPSTQSIGSLSNSLFSFASYFTGLGTVSSGLTQPFQLTSDNSGNTTYDLSTLSASGYVQLVYTYTPVAVPEPSTYALAAIGLGVAGFVRARRRKVAV